MKNQQVQKLLTVSLLFAVLLGNAQINQPEKGWVFEDSTVSRIDIIINQDSLDELLLEENWYEDHEYPADMYFTRNEQTDTVFNVGFRLRGNTSRAAWKKSFKIAINSFTPGERYHGLKKINLNGEHNDPSIARSKLNWDLLSDNQMPSTRTCHTEFYINGEYKGLYINVEHINDDFLTLRYGNNSGNLYKCLWPANLHYISSNPDDYKLEENGRRVYELKTNEEDDDYSDIAHFIDVLNNTANANLYCELSKVFDVQDFLEILAIDVLTGNWDGASFNKNNFYLYHNPETDRFQYIPYDLDNTLGIDWFGVDWTQRNIYDWSPSWEYLPLYERLMQNSEMKNIYSFFINQIIEQFSQGNFVGSIDDLRELIAPYAEVDIYRTLDYGFTYQEFLNSYNQNIPYDHVDSGIKPFYVNRANSATNQLNLQNISPIIRYIQIDSKTTQIPINVKAFVEDEAEPIEVLVIYTFNGAEESLELFDDGEHGDGEALDGWYANEIGMFQEEGMLELQVQAEDENGQVRLSPCEPLQFYVKETALLVINEFMAKNDTTIQDNTGAYSDWVELYNNSNESINLDGYFLSDDLGDDAKWAFPDTTISVQGYYLVWCSGNPDNGDNHAGFKLSAGGEDVALFKQNGESKTMVDGLSFGAQSADISYGRETDADPNWVFFTLPTPNSANGVAVGISESELTQNLISVYPNPYSGHTSIYNNSDKSMIVNVYDISGKLLNQFVIPAGERFEYLDNIESGIRILKWISEDGVGVLRVVKMD